MKDKISFRIVTWLYNMLCDIVLIMLLSKYIEFLIPSYITISTLFITLLIGRVIIMEYKSYCKKEINTRYSGKSKESISDEIISITLNKIIFSAKAFVVLSALLIARSL